MRHALAVSLLVCACNASESDAIAPPAGTQCVAGEMRLEDGSCLQAGFQPDGCPAGERMVDGSCLAAGIQDSGCPAGEVTNADGGCSLPGVPEGGCATGFESDGESGCRAVLPEEDCPLGMLAVPGDTTCRALMSCGTGRWGDIAVESTTQYVDGAYAGLDSDGTADKPWKTIVEAVEAASPGAIVAVAAGVYNEYVWIESKPVRLWGRCPEMVEIVASPVQHAAVVVWSADGTEIRGVSLTGKALGLYVTGSTVHADSMWIHHTQSVGFGTTSEAGTPEVEFSNALIEHAGWFGIYAAGARAIVDGVAIRDTQTTTDDPVSGCGFSSSFQEAPAMLTMRRSLVERNRVAGGVIQSGHATLDGVVVRDTIAGQHVNWKGFGVLAHSTQTAPARLDMTGSIVENNRVIGVLVAGADATIVNSVVRGTTGEEDVDGHGIQAVDFLQRGRLAVSRSVVDSNRHAGISVMGADATMEATIVRRTVPGMVAPDVGSGLGMIALGNPQTGATPTVTVTSSLFADNRDGGIGLVDTVGLLEGTKVSGTRLREGSGAPGAGVMARYGVQRSDVTLRACSIDDNEGYGIGIFGSDVDIEATAVRDTVPDPTDELGRGMEIEDEPTAGQRASVAVRTSAFERNPKAGIVAFAADLVLEGTLVRDSGGTGVSLNSDPLTLLPSAASVRWSAFDRNKMGAFVVWASTADIEGTRFAETAPTEDGAHGDGVVLIPEVQMQPQVVLRGSRIERMARAGIANFAGHVVVESTLLECDGIPLHGQSFEGFPYSYEDRAGNSCGCGEARDACKVLSQSLAPPQPVGAP